MRRTLGKVEGRNAINADTARKKAHLVSGELSLGIDRSVIRRSEAQADAAEEKANRYTLTKALEEYVDKKRRGKDAGN